MPNSPMPTGQNQIMLDIQYPDLFVPHGTLASIVTWLSERTGEERSAIKLVGHRTAVITSGDDGAVVEEVKQLGPNRLFGVLARPMGEPGPNGDPLERRPHRPLRPGPLLGRARPFMGHGRGTCVAR